MPVVEVRNNDYSSIHTGSLKSSGSEVKGISKDTLSTETKNIPTEYDSVLNMRTNTVNDFSERKND